jgi:D-alanyl-D-alanine carboxypeptidase
MARPSFLIAAAALSALPARAQNLDGLSSRLQGRLTELHAPSKVPGVTAAVVLADGRVIALAAGFADTARGSRMTPESLLPSGSTGKTFVAALMLQLVAEGKVGLEDPLSRWFGAAPWFPSLPNGSAVTVRMLLNHTSGIPDHVIERGFITDLLAAPTRVWKPEELLAYILDAKPYGPAGSAFHYTDTNYILLGMIIERVTGASYYSELERRVLKPLSLGGVVANDRMRVPGVAQGYSGGLERSILAYGRDSTGKPPAPGSVAAADAMLVNGANVVNPQFEWTGGGLATTAADLARWAKALYEAKVFPQAQLDESLKRPATADTGRYYGLGVGVAETPLGPRWGHGGFYPGYRTAMAYFPKQRVAVVVQTNTTAENVTWFMEQFVMDAVRMAAEAKAP